MHLSLPQMHYALVGTVLPAFECSEGYFNAGLFAQAVQTDRSNLSLYRSPM